MLVEFAFLSWLPMTGHDIVSIIEAQRMNRSNRWPDSFFSPIIADTRPSIFLANLKRRVQARYYSIDLGLLSTSAAISACRFDC